MDTKTGAASEQEQEFLRRIHELEHEVAHLNKELDGVCHTLANVIRGELRGISVSAHNALEGGQSVISEVTRDEILNIGAQVQKIGFAIDSTLKLSQLTRKPIRLDPVNLSDIVRSVGEDLKHRTRKEMVEIQIEEEIEAFCDPHLMELAMEKLLDNAIRFASQAKDPLVRFGSAMVNEKITYFIADNGPGFSPNQASRIFEPVMRLNESAGGVGLAMVKRIIERHDGKVWAQSQLGKGATFTFVLGATPHPEGSLAANTAVAHVSVN